ncbi:hypothetical protein BFP72_16690 [Reichenbachiella sp. 5M10]|nr:hypothetical protein BFP72_16690 [Reichenbachiella sp. 5M10]
MKQLFTTLLLVTTISAFAQDKVITTKLDTLVGKIIIQNGGKYDTDRVAVKNKKDKQRFLASDIREIYKKDDKYVTVKFNGRYQFMQVEIEGDYLSLYRYIDLELNSSEYAGQLLVTMDGRQHIISNIGFKKRLAEFLEDCKEVSVKIDEGEYSKSNLEQIIADYNSCIGAQSAAHVEQIAAQIDASKIDHLISSVEATELENKQELLDMLADVKSKLEAGQSIPNYLQGAIQEKLAGQDALLNAFDETVNGSNASTD